MRREEALKIREWVQGLDLPRGAVCLNIGSSTAAFRGEVQPHIDALLMRPLATSGLRIVHCDIKAAEGVDEVGDLLDPAFRARLGGYAADLLICSNLLEHLTDPQGFARACAELVRPGGYGLFTVPSSYPYHPDPIDTMLRLDPSRLAALLPQWQVVKAEQIEAGNHRTDLKAKGGTAQLVKELGRAALPFYKPRQWWPITHRLLWLFRPFCQAMVLLHKPAGG